ncbi:hypothetical protein BJ741DRAFT_583360 [Chytriomyces cf. hyalinus JEL632]|nr:hypothetical protein BJ741DRAFT_583360 [Chytriomyces cf. hyalinus JEL632]
MPGTCKCAERQMPLFPKVFVNSQNTTSYSIQRVIHPPKKVTDLRSITTSKQNNPHYKKLTNATPVIKQIMNHFQKGHRMVSSPRRQKLTDLDPKVCFLCQSLREYQRCPRYQKHDQAETKAAMIKSVATFLAAACLALLVTFTIPFSAKDIGTNPVKEAIGFSTAKVGSIEVSLNLMLAIVVTVQGFLITLAALSLLTQTTWMILSRSKAPLTILDAALRNYPQTVSVFIKQPLNMTSAAVLLVFLPVIIDAVQHATVQSLIVQGVAQNAGTANYKYLNTSVIKRQFEPLLALDQGFFTGFSRIAEFASSKGITSVPNTCTNVTRTCGTSETNITTALISCESVVDCTTEVNNYHDFDMICTNNETLVTSSADSAHTWLNSSVSVTTFGSLDLGFGHVIDWSIHRSDPTDYLRRETFIAVVHCRIAGAWVKRVENQLRGTLNKTVIQRYDSSESASEKNTTKIDPLSNLIGQRGYYMASSMGYLKLALDRNVGGSCTGQLVGSAYPYSCDKSLSSMSWASDPARAENDVAMIEQEMRFTVEMLMKHLFVNVMPSANTPGTCQNCSTRNARWVSFPAASAFFTVILGLVMVFAALSMYLEARHGCKDHLISAEKLFSAFGKTCDSRVPLISLDKDGQIMVDGSQKEQTYLIADQQAGV